jgi:Family of unknown function (DUF6527)
MMRHSHLEHRFVQHIPDGLEPGVLYISMEYGTAAHRCGCGCGEEVVTPFTPTDWKMTFDGETVSLNPSIGNWTLPCRSHYVIKRGRVIEAGPWTDKQVEGERQRDRAAKARFYGTPESFDAVAAAQQVEPSPPAKQGFVRRILLWLTTAGL